MNDINKLKHQFEACLLGGAIGDAWGSCFENMIVPDNKTTFYLKPPKEPVIKWAFTDDTQLTLATCEALSARGSFDVALLAGMFVRYYKEKRLTGLGASTLKAIIELEAGAHWRLHVYLLGMLLDLIFFLFLRPDIMPTIPY